MLTRGGCMTRLLALITSSVLVATTAYAQTAKSSIQGRVTDASGAVLQGASVTLQPGGEHTVSGNEGQFVVTGLTPGAYTLNVDFVGFEPFKKGVEMSAGQ